MSNMYITEPNTEGKILLHTSFGDIDIELWPQQAPKACRNFVQLCLENYYDDTVFHRLIPGFMLQGGDPTGTGKGGESIYGNPFIDEFHSRLRFNHRGLLAMANENKPNTNHSQFFFTLDACEFLNKKHTIFGKVVGNTIFNLLTVDNLETDSSTDRPLQPPRFISAEVLWNPFDDIVPRDLPKKGVNKDEHQTQKKIKNKRKATKDLKLLSFGGEEEEFEAQEHKKAKKKKESLSVHDAKIDKHFQPQVDAIVLERITQTKNAEVVSNNKTDAKKIARERLLQAASKSGQNDLRNSVKDDNTTPITNGNGSTKLQQNVTSLTKSNDEYAQLREELKQAKKKRKNAIPLPALGEKAKQHDAEIAFHEMLTPFQQQRQKYIQRKKMTSRAARQEETLKKLSAFQTKLNSVKASQNTPLEDTKQAAYHGQVLEDEDDVENHNDESNENWMATKLKFTKHIDDKFRSSSGHTFSTDDYTTIDTRFEPKSPQNRSSHRKRDHTVRNSKRSSHNNYKQSNH